MRLSREIKPVCRPRSSFPFFASYVIIIGGYQGYFHVIDMLFLFIILIGGLKDNFSSPGLVVADIQICFSTSCCNLSAALLIRYF